jgi:hypothetical protein
VAASVLDAPIVLGVPIAQAIAWVGTHADNNRKPEAAERCRRLANALGQAAEIEIRVPAVHVLCQAIDYLRGDTRIPERPSSTLELEAAAELQRIVDLLKGARFRGDELVEAGAQRLVTGSIHLVTGNPAQEIERVAKILGV